MSKRTDEALERRIVKLMATPNHYDYPAPIIYESQYGYDRAKCPEPGCDYDGFVNGYNGHYTHVHRPDANRQKAKRIIKAVRSHEQKET